jgi:hypothetical protein
LMYRTQQRFFYPTSARTAVPILTTSTTAWWIWWARISWLGWRKGCLSLLQHGSSFLLMVCWYATWLFPHNVVSCHHS